MMSSGCWWWGPGHFFGPPFGMIIGIVFWVLVIYGVTTLISRVTKGRGVSGGKEETPMEILKKRYAKGEINAEEFSRMKRDLDA